MRKETFAGIKAGTVTGLLCLPVLSLVLIGLTELSGTIFNLSFLFNTSQGPRFTSIAFLGLTVMALVLGAVGAVLGIAYAKLASRLPSKSTYLRALMMACVITAVLSITRLMHQDYTPDILTTNIVLSLLFAHLFNRWTK